MKIKLLFTAAVCSIVLTGCSTTAKEVKVREIKPGDTISAFDDDVIRILKIGKCQYISWTGSHGERGYSHKGDCNNPIHVYNKVKK